MSCSDVFHASDSAGIAVQTCDEDSGVITCDLCGEDVTSLALGDEVPN